MREIAKECKINWELKKSEIEKMEKIKMSEQSYYQGELKNGRMNGFGKLIVHSG